MASDWLTAAEIARGLELVAAREEAVERWRECAGRPGESYKPRAVALAASEPISEWADEHLGAALRELVALRSLAAAVIDWQCAWEEGDAGDGAEEHLVDCAGELRRAGYGEETPSDGE